MTVTHEPFPIRRGDHIELEIPVEAKTGGPADLTGATASFVYSRTPNGEPLNAALGSASATIGTTEVEGVEHPTILVTMDKNETKALAPSAFYHWASRITKDGRPFTVADGTFRSKSVPD